MAAAVVAKRACRRPLFVDSTLARPTNKTLWLVLDHKCRTAYVGRAVGHTKSRAQEQLSIGKPPLLGCVVNISVAA